MPITGLRETVELLAIRLEKNPDDLDAELCLRRLAEEYGENVYEMAVDCLTKDVEGTYSQSLQDHARKNNLYAGTCDQARDTRIPVIFIDDIKTSGDALVGAARMAQIIADLTPDDFANIPHDARLNSTEELTWEYFLGGYDVPDIAGFLMHPDGSTYRVNSVRKMMYKIQRKVMDCPIIGWRTAFAEDISRGPGQFPPAKLSFAEIVIPSRSDSAG